MVERISARAFHAADGVSDWRVVYGGAKTFFVTGSFARGVALVDEIGRLADAADHHPDIDLRYAGVTVTLFTHELTDISDRDLALAAQISAAAADLGISADPSRVQTIQVAIDAVKRPAVLAFWRAVLAYDQLGDEDLVDPRRDGPGFWFQQSSVARPERGRFHIDVSLPADQAKLRIAAAVAAGGVVVSAARAPEWWTLADPEGNLVDIAPWPDESD